MLTRSENTDLQEFFSLIHANVALSATGADKLIQAQKRTRVDRVLIINPAGFTVDPTNYWTIQFKVGATVVASWSTLTGAQGTLAADTFADMVLNVDTTTLIMNAGDTVSFAYVKTGAPANFPAGRIQIVGRML